MLGTQSFLDRGTKVGSQFLAEEMAREGWEVDYIPTLSSPMDAITGSRRSRFRRAWIHGRAPTRVAEGLVEWSVRSLYPAHRLFLRASWQIEFLGRLLPEAVSRKRYDVCISDICPNMALVKLISSRIKICRLNDWPKGFSADIHEVLIGEVENLLVGADFSEIWAVSGALEKYAKEQNPKASVHYMPNGVDVSIIEYNLSKKRIPSGNAKSAVYIGAQAGWFDYELVEQVAVAMSDWDFFVYGDRSRARAVTSPNLHWMDPVGRDEIPSVLSLHSVGIIPFKDLNGRLAYVERPLKFYEYLAAGLGVASTDVGSLRRGMQGFASFGNGVEGFMAAIVEAARPSSQIDLQRREELIAQSTWSARAAEMIARLRALG